MTKNVLANRMNMLRTIWVNNISHSAIGFKILMFFSAPPDSSIGSNQISYYYLQIALKIDAIVYSMTTMTAHSEQRPQWNIWPGFRTQTQIAECKWILRRIALTEYGHQPCLSMRKQKMQAEERTTASTEHYDGTLWNLSVFIFGSSLWLSYYAHRCLVYHSRRSK